MRETKEKINKHNCTWKCIECKDKKDNVTMQIINEEEKTNKYSDRKEYNTTENICKHFKFGRCHFGTYCKYAHKIEECRFFKENRCNFGDSCINLHRKMTIPESNTGKERYETKTIPEIKDMKERSTIKRGKGKLQCNLCSSEIINCKTLDTHT